MREIKFRAWDMGKMWENIAVLPNLRCATKPLDYDFGTNRATLYILPSDFQDFPPMQYTGLKDKNGKEIWEGDIIQSFHPIKLERSEPSEYSGKIVWSERSLAWVVECNDKFVEILCRAEQPEVIGNIYQNPELVKP